MPRLFIAIETTDELKNSVSQVHIRLPGIKWTPAHQLHITLSFLGNATDELLPQIKDNLSKIEFSPFTLDSTDTGFFPVTRKPSVFWLGFAPCPALCRLKRDIDSALQFLGVPIEQRPFAPHLTLARLRAPMKHEILLKLPPLAQCIPPQKLNVSNFVLFESKLLPCEAQHTAISAFPSKIC